MLPDSVPPTLSVAVVVALSSTSAGVATGLTWMRKVPVPSSAAVAAT